MNARVDSLPLDHSCSEGRLMTFDRWGSDRDYLLDDDDTTDDEPCIEEWPFRSPHDVFGWARPQKLAVVVVPGAGHFFHGNLLELQRILQDSCPCPAVH